MPRNWMDGLRQKLARTPRRNQANWRGTTLQVLEERAYLSVSSLFSGGEIQIAADADDNITLGIDPNSPGSVQLTVNNVVDTSLGSIQASTVRALTIIGSDSDNVIDISRVTSADFSFVDPDTLLGLQIFIDGDDGNDTIIGSRDLNDTLVGGNGADLINQNLTVVPTGNLTIDAGDGDDTVTGGTGNDNIDAGDGADVISGGDGNDTINGNDGNDSLTGDDGNDVIDAGDGTDTVDGGAGSDNINGMSGTDSLSGGADNDTIFGGSENDILEGGDGDDFLNGQAGNDTVNGNAGNDIALGGGGRDSLLGGDGDDILNGQSGNDTLAGEAGMDRIYGGSGDDALDGGDSNDTILGHGGNDTLTGGGGADLLNGGGGNDRVEGVGTFVSTGVTPVISLLASINDVTLAEGNGTTSFDFTVTLNTAPTQVVTVDYNVANGTAQAGADFQAASGTVTFTPGVTSQTVSVSVTGDGNPEDDERFFVNLIASADVALQDGQGIGTINNDDGPLPFGQPVNFDRFTDPNEGVDARRWMTTATDGTPGFVQGDPVTLTWGIVPDGTLVGDINGGTTSSDLIARLDFIYSETATGPDVTNRTWFALFQQVFNRYQEISGLTYAYEPNDDGAATATFTTMGAPGVLGVRPDVRIGGNAIDGDFGILAFNQFPDESDMTIDTADTAFLDLSQNSIQLRNTVSHEHGHGLGQRHVLGSTALMNPILNVSIDGPQEIDILSTQRQYGDLLERGTGNDNIPVATPLGVVDAATPVTSPDNVSIDDDSDIDVYQITVGADLAVSINLTPTGSLNLNVGPQNIALDPNNQNPGTTFNAQTLSDLGLELIDSDGTTVLASSFGGGFGQSESINGFTVAAAGNYFVRIRGSENSIQAYSLSVTAATVPPTTGDLLPDTLIGGSGNDTLIGADSDDLLNGGDGNDSIDGGGGNDSILGGAGNDTLNGQAGNDTLDGQGGDDVLNGGDGDDTINWSGDGDGDDTVVPGNGGDTLTVTGSGAADSFDIRQSGSDLVIRRGTSSISIPTTGLAAGIENVVVNAGNGNDMITVGNLNQVGLLALFVNGDDGNDTITAFGANIGSVRFQIDGGAGNDTLTGSDNADTIRGGAGLDVISGGIGNDTLLGGADDDSISGGDGNDVVDGNDGNDTALGDAGDDSISGSFGNDMLVGDVGNDTLNGGFGDDLLNGMAGDDSLLGSNGNDRIAGGSGDDTIDGGNDNDTIQGHSGADLINGAHGDDLIFGQAGDDTIFGDDGNDTIMGGNGNDLIYGEDGDDVVDGEGASDTIVGGDGNDTLRGGGSDDTILGQDGDDVINGNSGNDTASTGEGADTATDVEIIDESFVLSATLMQDFDTLSRR
ncbi:MAG: pre-peptidase C-terminal domain-containing protein [Rhodopirellula sp.]|nr:pre-peptidase C-terminal domain-containing protein [Rhodopirellula sp.]